MGLTEEQYTEMYKAAIKSGADIVWIREELQANDADLKKCFECISKLKSQQSFLKGYIMRLTIGLTAICTIFVNIVLWAFNYFGGK